MIFTSLDLAPEIQQALDACGYAEMTAVQEQAIIPARRGRDILANAQTGTGKTAAFALPILQQMHNAPKRCAPGMPRALILTPTRELAEQLAETISRYAQFMPVTVYALVGGGKISTQEKRLAAGIDIVIATPGRLLEHLEHNSVDLSNVEFVVLDEADRMLDMGFIADVQALLKKVPKPRQTQLYSATLSHQVSALAHKLLSNPEVIRVARQNAIADNIEHVVYPVEERRKSELFVTLIDRYNWFKVLVFTSTKAQADTLMKDLNMVNIKAAICHGDKSQGSRRRAIADFKADKIQVLIATEVAARGLDIQGLEYVVNLNLPYLAEDYVHRIGRTGRAGSQGHAISFVSREEERALSNIERLIGEPIRRITMRGFEVGSRDTLLKSTLLKRRPARANRATQTRISDNKGGTGGAANRKNKKGRAR